MIHGLHRKPNMPDSAHFLPGYRQPQFKWHVETWSSGLRPVQLNSGQVMHGEFAALNQFEYSVQPALTARNFQSDPRIHAEGMYRTNVGQKQVRKLGVVRQVQENFIARLLLWHASFSFARYCQTWTLPFDWSGPLPSNDPNARLYYLRHSCSQLNLRLSEGGSPFSQGFPPPSSSALRHGASECHRSGRSPPACPTAR
jgi:hypothetical protein